MKDLGIGTYSANFSLQQGVLALAWPCNVARQDALALLRSQPDELQRRLADYLQDELADTAQLIVAESPLSPIALPK